MVGAGDVGVTEERNWKRDLPIYLSNKGEVRQHHRCLQHQLAAWINSAEPSQSTGAKNQRDFLRIDGDMNPIFGNENWKRARIFSNNYSTPIALSIILDRLYSRQTARKFSRQTDNKRKRKEKNRGTKHAKDSDGDVMDIRGGHERCVDVLMEVSKEFLKTWMDCAFLGRHFCRSCSTTPREIYFEWPRISEGVRAIFGTIFEV